MPKKKAKEAEASIEETQPIEEETPEVEETPEAPPEETPVVEEAPEEEASVTVPVSSLAIDAQFEHGGELYQKRESTLTTVIGFNSRTERYRAFPSDTLVIPK